MVIAVFFEVQVLERLWHVTARGTGSDIHAVLVRISATIDNQDGSVVKRTGSEGTVCVGEMMRDSNDPSILGKEPFFTGIVCVSVVEHAEIFVLNDDSYIVK